jgi:UDP-2,3-diacylglucosamine pyrophosphatase LpxH
MKQESRLIIGDLHCPVTHPGYLDFCNDVCEKYKCNKFTFIGDVNDSHGVSRYPKEPACPNTDKELDLVIKELKRWQKVFPEADVCIGNHDERFVELAKLQGISQRHLKPLAELLETPSWNWQYDFVYNGVFVCHGTGQGGLHPAWNLSAKVLMSSIMGHCHSRAGISWRANPDKRIFSMDVGCGIDVKAYQFRYGRHCKEKPILGCGVIVNGIPYYEIMPISNKEKYAKRNYRK